MLGYWKYGFDAVTGSSICRPVIECSSGSGHLCRCTTMAFYSGSTFCTELMGCSFCYGCNKVYLLILMIKLYILLIS